MAVGASSKAPLSVTNLSGTILADVNRGRLRGWAAVGAAILAVLAAFAWPDLLAVIVLAAAATVAAFAYLWMVLSLPDVESDAEERDPSTGGPD